MNQVGIGKSGQSGSHADAVVGAEGSSVGPHPLAVDDGMDWSGGEVETAVGVGSAQQRRHARVLYQFVALAEIGRVDGQSHVGGRFIHLSGNLHRIDHADGETEEFGGALGLADAETECEIVGCVGARKLPGGCRDHRGEYARGYRTGSAAYVAEIVASLDCAVDEVAFKAELPLV